MVGEDNRTSRDAKLVCLIRKKSTTTIFISARKPFMKFLLKKEKKELVIYEFEAYGKKL